MRERRPWLLITTAAEAHADTVNRLLYDVARVFPKSVAMIALGGKAPKDAVDYPLQSLALKPGQPLRRGRWALLRAILRYVIRYDHHSICVDSKLSLGWLAPILRQWLGTNIVTVTGPTGSDTESPATSAHEIEGQDWQGRAQAVARVLSHHGGHGPIAPDLRVAHAQGVELLPTHDFKKPLLTVIVDTEEEFDWGAPVSAQQTDVFATQEIWRFQEMCEQAGVKPTYVLDYPVAGQDHSAKIFRQLHEQQRAEIGAHLHGWVTPPFDRIATSLDSYQGNLDPMVERAKLMTITQTIAQNIGTAPKIHKAGRYGIGPATADNLKALGYEIDLSPSPGFDFRGDGGPDFTAYSSQPFWFGRDHELLCLPTSGSVIGKNALLQKFLQWSGAMMDQEHFLRHSPLSLLADRVRLSPEGNSVNVMQRLAQSLIHQGVKVLTLSLHSTSLSPHANPYAKDESDVKNMLAACAEFFTFFREQCDGEIMTPSMIRERLLNKSSTPAS